MKFKTKRLILVPKRTVINFFIDDCPAEAAALAYYTAFSLPALLLIAVFVAAHFLDRETVVHTVRTQLAGVVGPNAADQVRDALRMVRANADLNGITAVLTIGVLFFSSTTALARLQASLNRVWNVQPDPQASEIKKFFVKRLFSLGLVVTIGLLLAFLMLVSTVMQVLSDVAGSYLGGISTALLEHSISVGSFLLFAFVFSALFKYLPDAEIGWSDVLLGGAFTALAFSGGRLAIGYYLGNTDLTNLYGAAGSLSVILLWTYYSSMIFLFGAEFTRAWAHRETHKTTPSQGAVRVRREKIILPEKQEPAETGEPVSQP